MWNAVDLFPVPGQGIFLLGSPRVERAELTAGEGALVVSRAADGPGALYLHAVRLNGEALDRSWLRYDEVLGGGRLDLRLRSHPLPSSEPAARRWTATGSVPHSLMPARQEDLD